MVLNLINFFSFTEDVATIEKLEKPEFKLIEKKENRLKDIGYGYWSSSSTYRSNFSGKAFYKFPIEENSSSGSYLTAGAKINRSSMKLKELSFEDEMKAAAQIGWNKEISTDPNESKKLQLELAQPVYDMKKSYKPSVEVSYDVKF